MKLQFLCTLSFVWLEWNQVSAFGGAHDPKDAEPQAVVAAEVTSLAESTFEVEASDEADSLSFSSTTSDKSARGYTRVGAAGLLCPGGKTITHSSECEKASEALGYGAKLSHVGLFTNIPTGCFSYGSAPLYNFHINDIKSLDPGYGINAMCADAGSSIDAGRYRSEDGNTAYFLAGGYSDTCRAGQFIDSFDECTAAAKAMPLGQWALAKEATQKDTPAANDYMEGCYLNPISVFFNDYKNVEKNAHQKHMLNICKQTCHRRTKMNAHQCGKNAARYQFDGKGIEVCRQACLDSTTYCTGIQFLPKNSRCYLVLEGDCANSETWPLDWKKGRKKGYWTIESRGCF